MRLDSFPVTMRKTEQQIRPKFEPLSFIWIRAKKGKSEHAALVLRQDGNELTYRPVRNDGALGKTDVILATSDRVRATSHGDLLLVVEGEPIRGVSGPGERWVITIPKRADQPHPLTYPSRAAAISDAKLLYGADTKGRISLVKEHK